MTKKDHELIAKAIKSQVNLLRSNIMADGEWGTDLAKLRSSNAKDRLKVVCVTTCNLANAMKQDNARFNLLTFMTACGFHSAGFDFKVLPAMDDDDTEMVVAVL